MCLFSGMTISNVCIIEWPLSEAGQNMRLATKIALGMFGGGSAPAPIVTVPNQSLGSELWVNGANPILFTADNPNSWTIQGEVGADPEVTERDPNQVHAASKTTGGAANFFSSATANQPRALEIILTSGEYYETDVTVSAFASGSCKIGDANAGTANTIGSAIRAIGLFRGTTTVAQINGQGGAPHNFTLVPISYKAITRNAQVTAPSANMLISQYYALPVSPVTGQSLWLPVRISDFAAGNYLLAFLTWTGSQWNITFYTVASHTRTVTAAAATNIGTTNGIRVNLQGDLIDLSTTADNGANWTPRGTQVTSALYNTATGYNVIASSAFTLGNLVNG